MCIVDRSRQAAIGLQEHQPILGKAAGHGFTARGSSGDGLGGRKALSVLLQALRTKNFRADRCFIVPWGIHRGLVSAEKK